MDWDKLRIFYAVAEAGSFTHAGEALNLSQSAISRQISALEDSLKVTLFHRHARGLILTEQGEVLHSTARDVFGKLAMTEAMLTESKVRPRGALKVTTTFAFGVKWLTPRLGEFLDLYPDIQLTLLIDDRELGPGDARGRCRDPHASAAATGFDPAPSGEYQSQNLCLEGISGRGAGSRIRWRRFITIR